MQKLVLDPEVVHWDKTCLRPSLQCCSHSRLPDSGPSNSSGAADFAHVSFLWNSSELAADAYQLTAAPRSAPHFSSASICSAHLEARCSASMYIAICLSLICVEDASFGTKILTAVPKKREEADTGL